MEFERIIWADPDLKTNFGHSIEAACTVNDAANKTRRDSLIIVSNKNIDDEALKLFENVYPFITNSCFQNLDERGETFQKDLETIVTEFGLGPSDLIIIPTSFTNEIIGVKGFATKHGNKSPKFALQMHQSFKPMATFSETFNQSAFSKNKKLLSDAFAGFYSIQNVASIWSTESSRLNQLLNSLAPVNIGQLPLPIVFHPELQNLGNNKFAFSFLGDGRYEKGLLLFLNAIKSLPDRGERIIIQDHNMRGYSVEESTILTKLLKDYEDSGRIEVIRKALNPIDFQKIIAETNIVVVPYHPKSYDKRVSEVYIIAKMYQCNCAVSSGTWMADESKKFGASGTFEYNSNDSDATIANLREELQKLYEDKKDNSKTSNWQSESYKHINCFDEIIKRIKNYYE